MIPVEKIEAVERDIKQIVDSRVPEQGIIEQLMIYEKGLSPVKLISAATINNGICRVVSDDNKKNIIAFDNARLEGRISKFIPASGAASRMFKSLSAVMHNPEQINSMSLNFADENQREVTRFLTSLRDFAFYDELKSRLSDVGKNIDTLLAAGMYKDIVDAVLFENGLNYASMPKGLVKFHNYQDHAKTAFEEHIAEAVEICTDWNGISRIHFTIAAEHKDKIMNHCKEAARQYKTDNIKPDITFSTQQPTTDTIAVDHKNEAFRTSGNTLLFRPGGHGALINNLNESGGDIVFIKNIDNVAHNAGQSGLFYYRKILGGFLVTIQEKVFDYLNSLEKYEINGILIDDIEKFFLTELRLPLPDNYCSLDNFEKKKFFFSALNRPLRVCGMVENQGRTGGGPFWIESPDGRPSLQIVESVRVDMDDPVQAEILNSSTHFNPVDIVCGLKDYKGDSFNLLNYINNAACFITFKSKDGRKLKAMEMPGLWNGAMADWLTLFVEIPVENFSPVKTANDLLLPPHQKIKNMHQYDSNIQQLSN